MNLRVQREPLDRWVTIRAVSAKRRMPLFDDLPQAIRLALYSMRSGPKWTFIESLSKSIKRGTTVKYLLRKIAQEDERQSALQREQNARPCTPA